MKYVVLTAKHHDGFALFDSAVSDFNVVRATPFRRDVVREVAEACWKHGLKLGLYYSQAQDWFHPGGAVADFMKRWDDTHTGSFGDYVDRIAIPQVKELLTNYGPVAVIWWDTPQDMTPEIAAKFGEVVAVQPSVIQNSRLAPRQPGDYRVLEGAVPFREAPGTPWEVCVMMNESWGHSRVHPHWAAPERLIRELVSTASLGGNYLLNVGPDAQGHFPPEAIERLEVLGRWMKENGGAIYGTGGLRLKRPWQQGRFTQKPGQLFAHVFLWPPDGKLELPVQGAVKKVAPLRQPDRALDFTVGPSGVVVDVGSVTPDPAATVFVLDLEGKPESLPVVPPLDADAAGRFDLLAAYAEVRGPEGVTPTLKVGKREGATPPLTHDPAEGFKIGGFASPEEVSVWRVRIAQPGSYAVTVFAGVQKGSAAEVSGEVRAGDQVLHAGLPVTGDAQTYQPVPFGSVSFPRAGVYEIVLAINRGAAPVSACSVWRIQLQADPPAANPVPETLP